MNPERRDRNVVIAVEVLRGHAYTRVGEVFGISKERVRQIVYDYLRRRRFSFSGIPGRHDVERARALFQLRGFI